MSQWNILVLKEKAYLKFKLNWAPYILFSKLPPPAF